VSHVKNLGLNGVVTVFPELKTCIPSIFHGRGRAGLLASLVQRKTGERRIGPQTYGIHLWEMQDGPYLRDDPGNVF